MADLILIPTEPEHRFLQPWLDGFAHVDGCNRPTGFSSHSNNADTGAEKVLVRLCGFGLIAAAARAMQLITENRPRRVILIGIAGTLVPSLAVGSAIELGSVQVDGVGVGYGNRFQNAGAMGWLHWRDPSTALTIGDRIDLNHSSGPNLLSVCAASIDPAHADQRRSAYPDAVAEDMEAFGVAVACQLAGVQLHVVRGISNLAGNRDFKTWQVKSALQHAAQLVDQILMNEQDQNS
jgi:futalosine hydrolase